MKKASFLFIFFTISCSEVLTRDSDINYTKESKVWVCYNEESVLHNQLCEPACFVPGDQTKFCWVLEEDDYCSPDFSHLNVCSL